MTAINADTNIAVTYNYKVHTGSVIFTDAKRGIVHLRLRGIDLYGSAKLAHIQFGMGRADTHHPQIRVKPLVDCPKWVQKFVNG